MPNSNDAGDNRNALLLANVMNSKVLNGGTQSLASAVNGYIGTVGTQTSQAQNGATGAAVGNAERSDGRSRASRGSIWIRRRPTCCSTSRPIRRPRR